MAQDEQVEGMCDGAMARHEENIMTTSALSAILTFNSVTERATNLRRTVLWSGVSAFLMAFLGRVPDGTIGALPPSP